MTSAQALKHRMNELRRAAQESEASESTASAPAAPVTRVLSRHNSTTVLSNIPTAPLALFIQSAEMLASEEPAGFATPENSECSEATSFASARRRLDVSGGRDDTGASSSSSSSDMRSLPKRTWAASWPRRLRAVHDTAAASWPPALRTIFEEECESTPQPPVVIETYSKVVFNPDALGKSPWQIYIIPDSQITSAHRAHLGTAVMSDQLEPLRTCECSSPACNEHAPPDMAAKVVVCYLLSRRVAGIRQSDLKQLVEKYWRKGVLPERGLWERHRIYVHTDEPLPQQISNIYKFKMFFV